MDGKLTVLLRDFGYKVEGRAIVELAIRGFTSQRVWGGCRSLFDAAEQLVPVIHDDEFTRRWLMITGGKG